MKWKSNIKAIVTVFTFLVVKVLLEDIRMLSPPTTQCLRNNLE